MVTKQSVVMPLVVYYVTVLMGRMTEEAIPSHSTSVTKKETQLLDGDYWWETMMTQIMNLYILDFLAKSINQRNGTFILLCIHMVL